MKAGTKKTVVTVLAVIGGLTVAVWTFGAITLAIAFGKSEGA